MEKKITIQDLKSILHKCKLRPKLIEIDQDQKMINMYWDENYFDELLAIGKISTLKDQLLLQYPDLNPDKIGTSDGHFFFFTK